MSDVIPKKSLGQHWLEDVSVLRAMCEAAAVSPTDVILEIGPGLGSLTKQLVATAAQVIAVEFDTALAAGLARRVPAGNLSIVEQSILSFDFGSLPHNYKIVANIPYYLTSNLIRVLSESTNPPSLAVLLVQKEVAQRVCAQPGDMSILAVTAQYYWEASLGMVVPAELFTPPPKVDSQIVVLKYREKSLFKDVDTKRFFRLVRAGFSQRRKTLVNSLSAGLAISKDDTRAMLNAADIPPATRAQALSLSQWYTLYSNVGKS